MEVVDGEHGGRDEPGEAEHGADDDDDEGDGEEVEVVAAALLQLVLLPVDNDGGDLQVHEDQNGGQDGEQGRQEDVVPPGVEV